MHRSVIEFLKQTLSADEVRGKDVVEAGSRIVFGSPRETILWHNPKSYVGVDMVPGPGVDVVLKAEKLSSRFKDVDIVIATELLEHVEFWKDAVRDMKDIVRVGGLLLVTTRSPGFPYHAHPGDFWRFTIQDFIKIFADFDILSLVSDPQKDHPGVFLKAQKPASHVHADLSSMKVASVG